MKRYFERILRYLSLALLFLFFLIISIAGCIRMNQKNELEFKRQIDKIWTEAVRTDCYKRLGESEQLFIQYKTPSLSSSVSIQTKDTTVIMAKDSLSQSEGEVVKQHKILQTALLALEHPVQVQQLDSIFQNLLIVDNLRDLKVFSSYYDSRNGLVKNSKADTSFFAKTIATNEIKTGVSGEITLCGYVVVPAFYFIKRAKLFYVGWVCFMVCVSLIFCSLFQKKKVTKNIESALSEVSLPKAKNLDDSVPDMSQEIFYDSTTRTLTYMKQSVGFTSLSGLLFLSLLQSPNHSLPYETIISVLWPDESGDKGRLEQHCCTLRKKLKEISDFDISIETISGVGYALHIPEGIEICLK